MAGKFKPYQNTIILAIFLFTLGIFAWGSSAQVSEASGLAQAGWNPTSTFTPTPADTTPTAEPTDGTTETPTAEPTDGATATPTAIPTDGTAETPTAEPTGDTTETPTAEPTGDTTETPTAGPTGDTTETPTAEPTDGATATPVPSTTPTSEPSGLTVEVVGPTEVNEGNTFSIDIVASNIPDPGIFGFQFQLNWDDAVFSLVDGSAALNTDFPVTAKFDIGAAAIEAAASREGDVDDLTGPLTLLSVEFQANAVTDPDASSLTLSGVKLGRKGGIDVPVDQVINLDVVVVVATSADITGNVKVQGRADDNQAGHSITDGASLSTVTDANGDFLFSDVDFGLYTLTANSDGFLAATCADADHNTTSTALESVTLLAGDLDDSGEIDITDAVAIGTVFGSTASDEVADLNVDGEVDILDLILMSANFGQTSEGNPWVCQP